MKTNNRVNSNNLGAILDPKLIKKIETDVLKAKLDQELTDANAHREALDQKEKNIVTAQVDKFVHNGESLATKPEL